MRDLRAKRMPDGWAIGEWFERAFVPMSNARYTIDQIEVAVAAAREAESKRGLKVGETISMTTDRPDEPIVVVENGVRTIEPLIQAEQRGATAERSRWIDSVQVLLADQERCRVVKECPHVALWSGHLDDHRAWMLACDEHYRELTNPREHSTAASIRTLTKLVTQAAVDETVAAMTDAERASLFVDSGKSIDEVFCANATEKAERDE